MIVREHYRYFDFRLANRQKIYEEMKKALNICFAHIMKRGT